MSPTIPLTVSAQAETATVELGGYVVYVEPADHDGLHISIHPKVALTPDADLPPPIREVFLPADWPPDAIGPGAAALVRALVVSATGEPGTLILDETDRNPDHAESAIAVAESADGVSLLRVERPAQDEAQTTLVWLPDAACVALEALLKARRERQEAHERVVVALEREAAQVALKALRMERSDWRAARPPGAAPSPYDDAIAALEQALGEAQAA